MVTIQQFLKRLYDHSVEFVVVGGVAANIHGSTRMTLDLDVCALLDETNLKRIVGALRDLHPKFRMHPAQPALFDMDRLIGFRNLNLTTDWGVLDILGEITGVGTYQDVLKHSVEMTVYGLAVKVLDLPALIDAKRAAGRPKDLQALPELEFIRSRTIAPRTKQE
ncbi:MAG: nucleotidyltransferase [Planctomycetota bacterium]|nr:nucleotidyltransferase [Planctomycetota bacterium]